MLKPYLYRTGTFYFAGAFKSIRNHVERFGTSVGVARHRRSSSSGSTRTLRPKRRGSKMLLAALAQVASVFSFCAEM